MTAVTRFIEGKFVIAGTGSRSYTAEDHEATRLLYSQVELNRDVHDLVMMSGGSTGWDAAVAKAAWELGVPYVLCIPNQGYGPYYWKLDPDGWQFMVSQAAAVEYTMEDVHNMKGIYLNGKHSNFVRNDRMVELAHAFLVYDPTSSGTKHCLASIEKANKPFKVLSALPSP